MLLNKPSVCLGLVFSIACQLSSYKTHNKLLSYSYYHSSYTIDMPFSNTEIMQQYYDFRNANLLALNNFYAWRNWNAIKDDNGVSFASNKFYNCIYCDVDAFTTGKRLHWTFLTIHYIFSNFRFLCIHL